MTIRSKVKSVTAVLSLNGANNRDLDYIDEMIRCQQMLVRALELFEQGDKKSLHNANKAFEVRVREARRIKKDMHEDIQKAQAVVDLMDKIIEICDENRQ